MTRPRTKVVISAPYLIPTIDTYRPVFEQAGVDIVVANVKERLEEAELLAVLPGAGGILAGDDRITRAVLKANPELKVISKWGTGTDSFDHDAARELGVKIYNVPNAFSEPVSDSIVGYILAFARNLMGLDRAMKDGVWKKIPGSALCETTIGVIGVGNVGRALLRKLSAFGAMVIANDTRTLHVGDDELHGAKPVSLVELLKRSDFISINCDLNPTSFHLLSDDQFRSMKSNAVVVNCARGPIIDEPALVRALETSAIAGAALDVFEDEPLPSNSALMAMHNVFLAPHNSNSSPEAWRNTHTTAIHNLFLGLGISRDISKGV